MATKSSDWTAQRMYELGTRHAELEARGKLDELMATLVEDPVYEFHPAGLRMTGRDRVRRYYAQFIEQCGVLCEHIVIVDRDRVAEHDRIGDLHHGRFQMQRQQYIVRLRCVDLRCKKIAQRRAFHAT